MSTTPQQSSPGWGLPATLLSAGGCVLLVALAAVLLTGSPKDDAPMTVADVKRWARDDAPYEKIAEDNGLADFFRSVRNVGPRPEGAAGALDRVNEEMAKPASKE